MGRLPEAVKIHKSNPVFHRKLLGKTAERGYAPSPAVQKDDVFAFAVLNVVY
jgi:hypothetical protein